MNGFRPLPIFRETSLVVTGKDEELGFTLESESNLVNESYLSENYDLSNFIGQKPIAIFIENKDCAICLRCIEKLLPVKKIQSFKRLACYSSRFRRVKSGDYPSQWNFAKDCRFY